MAACNDTDGEVHVTVNDKEEETVDLQVSVRRGASGSSEVPLEASSIFNINRPDLVHDIDLNTSYLGEWMLKLGAISSRSLEIIKDYPRRMEQNRNLLAFIEKKPWMTFVKFRRALLNSGYEALVGPWPPFDLDNQRDSDSSDSTTEATFQEGVTTSADKCLTLTLSNKSIALRQEIQKEIEINLIDVLKGMSLCTSIEEKEKHLNLAERLHCLGVTIGACKKGSIVMQLTFSTVVGLDEFIILYRQGELKQLLEEYMIYTGVIAPEELQNDSLHVNICIPEYKNYRKSLRYVEETERKEIALIYEENLQLKSKLMSIKKKVEQKKQKRLLSMQGASAPSPLARLERPGEQLYITQQEAKLSYIPKALVGLPDSGCLVGDVGCTVRFDSYGKNIAKFPAHVQDQLVCGLILHEARLFMLQEAFITEVSFDYSPAVLPKNCDKWSPFSEPKQILYYQVPGARDLRDGLYMGNDILVLVDYGSGRIIKYNLRNSTEKMLLENLNKPRAISKITHGEEHIFFVTEMGANHISVYGPAWERLNIIGQPGKAAGELDLPHVALVTQDESLIVADYHNQRISEFSTKGAFIGQLLPALKAKPVNIFIQGYNLWVLFHDASFSRYNLYKEA